MPTYYKYAERNADSQVNWAQVGSDITDMLQTETKIREEKKGALQKAFQDDMDNLANAPQGKWQDGNETVNNFAHDMMQQQLIDNRLLKSGQMKPRDYTLRRENYNSQTKTLFELQKLLQSERENTIDLYQKGEIQGLNISNQSDVEAYSNFAKSKAKIDPYSSNISMGIYEDKEVDGKTVKVLKKSTPVNVLKGQIVQKIPTFKVDSAIDKYVPTLGKEKDYIYQLATTSKAGSIVELMGVGALENLEKQHPELKGKLGDYKGVIDNFNSAIDQKVKSWLATPYQVSSILTENTGNYNPDSFTWDETEAKGDKNKILKKIDPLTGFVTLDENAPHYKEQKKEAEDWIRNQLLSKLDKERSIKVTGTIPYPPQPREEPEWKYREREGKKEQDIAAGAWNKLYTGTTLAEKKQAAETLIGTPLAEQKGLIGIIPDDKGNFSFKYTDPQKNRTIAMFDDKGEPIALQGWSELGVELHGVVDSKKAMQAGGGGKGFGALQPTEWGKVTATRQGAAPKVEKVVVTPSVFTAESKKAVEQLKNIVPPGFTVKDVGKYAWSNDIMITAPNGDTYPFETKRKASQATEDVKGLQQFLDKNSKAAPAGKAAPSGQGVGSQYNQPTI